jgi:uncharacterized membrane protein YhhN
MSLAVNAVHVVAALGIGTLSVAEYRDVFWLKAVSKLVAALAFLMNAIQSSALSCSNPAFWVFCGLCCGFMGDIFLLFRHPAVFQLGVLSFLINHAFYIAANVSLGVSTDGVVMSMPFVVVGGLCIWAWLRPHVGDMSSSVAVYLVVICTVLATSFGAVVADLNSGRLCLLCASVVFLVSDLLVARDRFMQRDTFAMALNVPLYFGAQLLFGGCACVA